MQESIRERKKAAKLSPEESRVAGEQVVLAKIASLDEPDRAMAERFHAIDKATAPELSSRTWCRAGREDRSHRRRRTQKHWTKRFSVGAGSEVRSYSLVTSTASRYWG
jgi:hypothetical protein